MRSLSGSLFIRAVIPAVQSSGRYWTVCLLDVYSTVLSSGRYWAVSPSGRSRAVRLSGRYSAAYSFVPLFRRSNQKAVIRLTVYLSAVIRRSVPKAVIRQSCSQGRYREVRILGHNSSVCSFAHSIGCLFTTPYFAAAASTVNTHSGSFRLNRCICSILVMSSLIMLPPSASHYCAREGSEGKASSHSLFQSQSRVG